MSPCSLKQLFATILLMWSISAYSQTLLTDEDGIMHWEADFRAGLNTDGYQFDFGLIYFTSQYIGLKAQLGVASEIEELGDWGKDEWETGHSYTTRFKFTTSAVLRTPRLVHWKSQDAGFYLFAEPGFILSPGAKGSHRARYFNWDVKCGINLQLDRFIVSIGYGISNYCLYSGYPQSQWGTPDNDSYITHSAFVGAAFKF